MSRSSGPDEETPLLQGKTRTHLPWTQINLVFVALFAEPISSAYIFPFINQLIGELGITGGDDRKIGYYAGLIESLFFLAQALTTWQWSRLSDSIGRRPIILTGLLGITVSTIAFGLSRTLGTLIMSRCIAGILNGNIGVMKSMLGDLTDQTNMAQVFPLIPAIFIAGATIAPLYGGALAKPQDQWPELFRGEFWETYPYFLPSFVSGCSILLIFLICLMFMKESLPSKKQPANNDLLDGPAVNDAQPIPMLAMLKIHSVMLPTVNYGLLALIDISFFALFPLFCSAPIAIGGLGLSPPIIGLLLAISGIVDGCAQGLFGTRLIEWLGAKKLFSLAILFYWPLILFFPIMSAVVATQGTVGPAIWVLLVLQLIFMVLADLSYAVISIFVTRSAPNKRSLGSVNGLSQSLASIARAIGPALTTSTFAVSKEYHILGGNLVYVVQVIIIAVLVIMSRRLPDLEEKDEE